MSEEKVKKPIWKKWWVWGIAAFVFIIIISALSGEQPQEPAKPVQEAQEAATDEKPAVETVEQEPTKEPPAEEAITEVEEVATPKYQQVFTFSGTGAKKSEPFKITGDRFKVKYDCKGSLCQAWINEVGQDLPKDIIMNETGSTKDETILYGAGEYYIDSNTLGSYTIIVEDYK